MEILQFQNLPVANESPAKVEAEIISDIEVWSEGRTAFYSIAFMAIEGDPKEFSSYRLRLGHVADGHLVASKQQIIAVSNEIKNIPEELQAEAKAILDLYFLQINAIPYWGCSKFMHFIDLGKTPRLLEGPNVSGNLKTEEYRWVVYDEKRQIVYGPLAKKGEIYS